MDQRPLPNIIVFGETGTGKSSIINMLDGGEKACVSSQARGVTFANSCYEKTVSGARFRVFDTVGLNEGNAGAVASRDAIEQLHGLICQLEDGVNLLVCVMRAPRIKDTTQKNYEMFYEVFCQKKVPIVIVVTGLEGEMDMDKWWDNNRDEFVKQKMLFKDHACITATKGKLRHNTYSYQDEYDESRGKVEQLILANHSRDGWKMDSKSWFSTVVETVLAIFGAVPSVQFRTLARALYLYGGLSKQGAKDAARMVERRLKTAKENEQRV